MSSKVALEGYEKVEYTHVASGEQRVTYHKYVDKVEGVLSKIETKTLPFGTYLNVSFYDKESNSLNTIQTPLEDKYGYTQVVQALMNSLANYKIGEQVAVSVSIKDNEYTNKAGELKKNKQITFWVNYANILTDAGKNDRPPFLDYATIPKLEKVEKRGQTSYNTDARDDFYYEMIGKIEAQLLVGRTERQAEYEAKNASNATNATPPTPKEAVTTFASEDDDLPF